MLIAIVLVVTASGQIESVDGMSSLNMARNLVYKGSWEVTNPKYGIGGGTTDPIGGKYYSGASKGYAIAMLPAVWISKFIYEQKGYKPAANFPLESDYLLTFLASFINPIIAFCLFIFLYLLFTKIVKNKNKAVLMALIISLTTNLLPLAKHSFPNLLMTLESVILLWSLVNGYLVVAVATIVALIFSYNMSFGLILLLAGYYLIDRNWQNNMVKIGLGVGLLVGVMVFFEMGGFTWLTVFTAGENGQRDIFQAMWGMLLSSGRSITIYSPVWGLALITALATWRKSNWSRLMIFGTVVFVGFYSLFDIWSGELSWGPRYLAPLIPLAGLVLADNWGKESKKWLLGLAVFGLYVQLVGVTVPYETQYQGIKVGKFDESMIDNRQAQFDYWSLGEFLPKYSPIYRLKKNMVHRWLLIPNYWGKRPTIVFAGGASLPIEGDKVVRRVATIFRLESSQNISFSQVTMDNIFWDIGGLKVCVKNVCQTSAGTIKEGKLVFYYDKKISVGAADELVMELLTDNKSQRFELSMLELGENKVDMGSNKMKIEDGFYNKNTVSTDDREVLYQRYYDRKSVTNMTADFWWVRQLVYFR